jgi:hypothetical protein
MMPKPLRSVNATLTLAIAGGTPAAGGAAR